MAIKPRMIRVKPETADRLNALIRRIMAHADRTGTLPEWWNPELAPHQQDRGISHDEMIVRLLDHYEDHAARGRKARQKDAAAAQDAPRDGAEFSAAYPANLVEILAREA